MAKQKKKPPFLPRIVVDGREVDLARLTEAQEEWLRQRKEKVARWIKL